MHYLFRVRPLLLCVRLLLLVLEIATEPPAAGGWVLRTLLVVVSMFQRGEDYLLLLVLTLVDIMI